MGGTIDAYFNGSPLQPAICTAPGSAEQVANGVLQDSRSINRKKSIGKESVSKTIRTVCSLWREGNCLLDSSTREPM
jgi:sRNA-binding protein